MLDKKEIEKIIKIVKKEPQTVQDIAKYIKKSWVTTNTYLKKIKEDTGLINIKTFRKGTQGALKIVYYCNTDGESGDELKNELLKQIKHARRKTDFDMFEIVQHIENNKKNIKIEEYDETKETTKEIAKILRKAQETVYIFSGNLSFLNQDQTIPKIIEELIKQKVIIKILCRINIASLNNIAQINHLLKKYPGQIEIKHSFQPLRGFVIDEKIAWFKCEETLKEYKPGELQKNTRIIYEIIDKEWIHWFERVFWNIYRNAIDYQERKKQIELFF